LYRFPSVAAARVAQYDTNAPRFRSSYFNVTVVIANVQRAVPSPSTFGFAFQKYRFRLSRRTSWSKRIGENRFTTTSAASAAHRSACNQQIARSAAFAPQASTTPVGSFLWQTCGPAEPTHGNRLAPSSRPLKHNRTMTNGHPSLKSKHDVSNFMRNRRLEPTRHAVRPDVCSSPIVTLTTFDWQRLDLAR